MLDGLIDVEGIYVGKVDGVTDGRVVGRMEIEGVLDGPIDVEGVYDGKFDGVTDGRGVGTLETDGVVDGVSDVDMTQSPARTHASSQYPLSCSGSYAAVWHHKLEGYPLHLKIRCPLRTREPVV